MRHRIRRRCLVFGCLLGFVVPAVAQQSTYTLVFGEYRSEDFAVASAQAWRQRGLELEAYRFRQANRTTYRLIYGRFATESEAKVRLGGVKDRFGIDAGYVWALPLETPGAPTSGADTLVIERRDTVFVVYLPGTPETDTLEYLAPDGRVLQKVPIPHDEGRFPSVARPQQEGLLLAVIDSLDHRLRVSVDVYVDVYYAGQNRVPEADGTRQLETHGWRSEQFGINTAQIAARLEGERFRALTTLQVGDIRTQGWDPVTTSLSLLQEAHLGVRLTPGVWLDAGLFTTHIGGEAIFPRDNWISSLALVTYFEPFIQTGARLSWDVSPKLQVQLHALNGYNTVEDNNRSLSGGWLLTWLVTDGLTLYTSGLVGNEQPTDSASVLRTYTNTVLVVRPTDWLSVKLQGDFAIEPATETRSEKEVLAGQASVRVAFTDQFNLAVRGEYYRDRGGMLSPSVVGWGGTAQLEYKPTPNTFLRLEGRWLQLEDQVFFNESDLLQPSNNRLAWSFGIGAWL